MSTCRILDQPSQKGKMPAQRLANVENVGPALNRRLAVNRFMTESPRQHVCFHVRSRDCILFMASSWSTIFTRVTTRHNVGSMMGQRRRRRPNIKPTFVQYLLLARLVWAAFVFVKLPNCKSFHFKGEWLSFHTLFRMFLACVMVNLTRQLSSFWPQQEK